MRALPFLSVALASAAAHAGEGFAPTEEAALGARLGSFLPLSTTPGTPASNVRTFGSYDGAREGTVLGVDTTALFASWFQLQAGARYEESEIRSHVLAELALLEDDERGLDLELGVGWQERGINEASEARAMLAAGHEVARTYLTAGATLDVGVRSERGLAVNAAALHAMREDLYAGIDSRLQLDLERDADEPMHESTWRLQAGPVVTYVASKYAVTASAGVAQDQPRMAERRSGVFGLVGVGAAF